MNKALLPFLCITMLCCLTSPAFPEGIAGQGTSGGASGPAAVSGATYCSVPPIPGAGMKSNVLVLLDNSLSMSDLAYDRGRHCTPAPAASCSSDAGCNSGEICRDNFCTYLTPAPCGKDSDCVTGQSCTPDSRPSYCVDDSYRDANSYSGYFDPKTIYRYDGSSARFVADSAATLSKIDPCSGSCAASTGYLSVDMSGTAPNRTVQSFQASGNFLNWLSASKLDQAKQVLTGGKLDADGLLAAESRGCNGKRFVKLVPDAPQITFTVRGGNPVPGAYLYEWQPGPPGPTVIEIYDRSYPKSSCLAAARDWESASAWTTLSSDLRSCMGEDYMWDGWHLDWYNVLQHVPSKASIYLQMRSICYANNAQTDISFRSDCARRYLVNPVDQIQAYQGDDVCGSKVFHAPVYHDPSGGTRNASYLGFIGAGNRGGYSWDLTTTQAQAKDYCTLVSFTPPPDPSATPLKKGSPSAMPPFIFDAGIVGLGTPAGAHQVRLALPSSPTGVIQQFGSDINFGAMTFNDDGLDGGKVVAAVGAPVGTHQDPGAGLVYAIDHVATRSSTPLADSFYNAIGYFANRSDLRLQPGDFSPPAPAQYSCQKNAVLLVSDGISSADKRQEPKDLVTSWVGAQPAGDYGVDDLSWLAKNRSSADFSQLPASSREFFSTSVVYTGPACGVYSNGSCVSADEGVPEKLMQLTASKGGGNIGRPGNLAVIEDTFRNLLQELPAGSGTDASLVSTGDGNGGLFLQDRFYPVRRFEAGTSAAWVGELQSLWYYIDPFLADPSGAGSTLREDTDHDLMLTLKGDRIVSFDPAGSTSQATVDLNGDGRGGGAATTVSYDDLQTLWRAGKALFDREPATRQLKTSIDGSTLVDFAVSNAKALAPYLNVTETEAAKLIAYVLGTDQEGYRSRRVTITDQVSHLAATREWKLGDIVSSSPQVQSPVPLASYHLPPPRGYNDKSYAAYLASDFYQGRGMVYVGANDGILHAFNLGRLETGRFDRSTPVEIKAKLTGSDPGKEVWGYIPKNVLPYLKFLAETNYRHMALVDGKLALVDAAIGEGNAWRTVLVGGMGLGGASADSANCPAGSDCVAAPLSNGGYSSYFALDVTDPANPALLWEFSDKSLGFSTSGPAIVKSGGKWFALFGSGPTGPIDANHQFLGRSNQPLTFFVVELKAGAVANGAVASIGTGIPNAFAGSLTGATIDTDRWNPSSASFYSDDAIYAGYTNDGTDGGVLRILTSDSANVAEWKWSYVVQGVGPVTGGIARIQDRKSHHLWLYFGTGRYFFNLDDPASPRALYGVKEPCYHFTNVLGAVARPDGLDPSCSGAADVGKAGDALTSSKDGWRFDLAAASPSFGAERALATPTATGAGAVFFPTFQPGSDPCHPGNSYLIEMNYDTGAAPAVALLQGKAVLPLSSGGVYQGSLGATGGHEAPIPGRAGSVKVVTNSGLRPVRKIIHIQER